MTNTEENHFKKLIIDALGSDEGKQVLKKGTLYAFSSDEIKQALKEGVLEALRSDEGHDILIDSFTEGFHEIIAPVFDEHSDRISKLERQAGVQT